MPHDFRLARLRLSRRGRALPGQGSRPLLHAHAVVSIHARRPYEGRGGGSLLAHSLRTHIVAADTLYALLFMEEGAPSARLGGGGERDDARQPSGSGHRRLCCRFEAVSVIFSLSGREGCADRADGPSACHDWPPGWPRSSAYRLDGMGAVVTCG